MTTEGDVAAMEALGLEVTGQPFWSVMNYKIGCALATARAQGEASERKRGKEIAREIAKREYAAAGEHARQGEDAMEMIKNHGADIAFEIAAALREAPK